MRKLEDWEVRMMRRFRDGGWSHADLGFFFGISQAAVSKACKGQSYKQAGGPVETGQYSSRRGG